MKLYSRKFSIHPGEPVSFQNRISLVHISVPGLMQHGHLLARLQKQIWRTLFLRDLEAKIQNVGVIKFTDDTNGKKGGLGIPNGNKCGVEAWRENLEHKRE